MKPLKYWVIAFCVALLCNACNNKSKQTNDLIPNNISIKYETQIVRSDSSEIFSSFKINEFTDKLIATVLTGKIAVREPFDTSKVLTKAELQKIVGSWQDTVMGVEENTGDTAMFIRQFGFDPNELTKILFEENWTFNKESFVLTKDIKNWCPVRVYFKEADSLHEDTLKKMLFWVKQHSNVKPKKASLIKKDVTTEFSLYNSRVPSWLADMNPSRFLSIIIDNVLSGKVAAYDFFDSKKKLSIAEIKSNLGETVKTYSVENPNTETFDTLHVTSKMDIEEIRSVIFTEDWYIDWETLSFFKTVKSIAPVRIFESSHDGGDYEIEKKIPFIVYIKNN